MQPDEILSQAAALVGGDRAEQHGDYQRNMDMIAALWTAYAGHRFEARDVAWMLALVKVARDKTGGGRNPDNPVDAAGYAALAGAVK